MSNRFHIILVMLFISSIVFSQKTRLLKDQKENISRLVKTFQAGEKNKIAGLINYPLRREYPLKDIKSKAEFIKRFNEVFDSRLLSDIVQSKPSDWSVAGWQGIMLGNGMIWLDDSGKISVINYQSKKEKDQLANAIAADKQQLPKTLRNFKKPAYLIHTKNYHIRIDEIADNHFRYASWKVKDKKAEPELVIPDGSRDFQGSGGNHTITFRKQGYAYVVSVFSMGAPDTPEASLTILKNDKTILKEDGIIIRN